MMHHRCSGNLLKLLPPLRVSAKRQVGSQSQGKPDRVFGSFHCSNVLDLLKQPQYGSDAVRYEPPTRPFELPEGLAQLSGRSRGTEGSFGRPAREHFNLGEEFTFLNHGAFGATLSAVLESKQKWANYIERQPVRFIDRELFPHLAHVSRGLASILGCPADEIVPLPNATTGINTVVRSWQRRFKPGKGDRIAYLSCAYGSTKKLLTSVAAESGIVIDEVPIQFPLHDEDDILDALAAALNENHKLIVLDHIPSNAPFIIPIEKAVHICRERSPNAFVMVDSAHGLAGLDLQLTPPVGDAFVTNCHKWFCGSKGTAVLHVDPKHQEWIQPLVLSHGYGADFVSGFYWAGLTDFSAWLSLDAGLAFWEAVGLQQARDYNYSIAQDAADSLMEAWDTSLAGPHDLFGTMRLVELPTIKALAKTDGFEYIHAEAVQNALYKRRIEVPVKVLSGRMYVRISAQIYNELEDYEPLRDALLELAAGADL